MLALPKSILCEATGFRLGQHAKDPLRRTYARLDPQLNGWWARSLPGPYRIR
jgi:hypothetical protein